MAFILPLFDFLTAQKTTEATDSARRYFDITRHYRPTPMFPFIFERLFSTFLSISPAIRGKAYVHSAAEIKQCCLNDLEWKVFQTVHEMVDQWDLEAQYNTDRRVYFQALGQAFQGYGDLYFESYGPAF